jgi:fructan beta-fructosidase
VFVFTNLLPVLWAANDILIDDFETLSYEGWTVEGEAFGTGPAQGTLEGQMPVSGFQGQGLVNSYLGGDGPTGRLVSDLFTIQRKHINFLIGGGNYPGETCMNLVVNGEIVRTATGPNDKPGGSEALQWSSWDVSEFLDQVAHIEIVDARNGGWGHINVDYIHQSDKPDPTLMRCARLFTVDQPYLLLPVKNGAAPQILSVEADGEVVRMFTVELAEGEPDFWVYLQLDEFQGKSILVASERFTYQGAHPGMLDALQLSDTVPGFDVLYQEKYRPQFHFSSRRGWNNDPNGLVYYEGEWHLFYQHNPHGWGWGNMTWGHAVSEDLVHWTELGDAIHPDKLGTIFSGSAVVDSQNTTGFKTGDEDPIVAVYTSAGGTNPFWSEGQRFTQSIAYSNDRGRTWTKYAQNPVQGHVRGENRDPKVIWHEPSGQWVIVLYLDENTLGFFTSPDLKTWTLQSELESFYECPELFELPVDGDSDNKKWVLYGASGAYLIGDFDGKTFAPETGPIQYSHSDFFYASQTFSNVPASDSRRIQIGWGRATMPGMPFNQMMTFPVELTLRSTDDGLRMFANPVREIESLRMKHHHWENKQIIPGANLLDGVRGELLDIDAEFVLGKATKLGLRVRGVPITYDAAAATLICQDREAPLNLDDGSIRLRILVDRTSIEIYAYDGQVYLPVGVLLDPEHRDLRLEVEEMGASVASMDIYELKSAWPLPALDASAARVVGPETNVILADGDRVTSLGSGIVRLEGNLTVQFDGRIVPHENTSVQLFDANLGELSDRFANVVLPEGWLCDVEYAESPPNVTLKNFRPDRAPAFPTAEGFGKYTIGGRGGRVIEVTNLNDSGPGSFREACEAEGPRTVVFRVSGTIPLESELEIKNPYITIAGQTAPGDGICIKNYQVEFETDHVIMRFLRFRPGDEAGKEQDAFGGQGDHVIIDHCSVSWGVDETLSINKASNLTVQWCMVTESLTNSIHKKGAHGYGGLWGGPGGSFHHNILAHHTSRNPRASGNRDSGLLDFRNNVIYNWGFNSAYGGELWPRNWINNYYKSGPATSDNVRDRIFLQKNPRGKMYADGNLVYGFPEISANNWNGGIDFAEDGEATEETLRAHEPYVVAPVNTQSAERAYELVLRHAGASLNRDSVDARIVEEIRSGTAQFGETYKGGGKGIIDSQTAVGGWPELQSEPAPPDTDHDGMPNDWETAHGLDPTDEADGPMDRDNDGYTNLEEYLNSLACRLTGE